MDKSTHEEHLSQPLQTNNKQFKIAVTFLSGYNGIFNVKIQIISSILRKQLLIKMVLLKLLYLQELMKSNH